jgi:hypothetical protein
LYFEISGVSQVVTVLYKRNRYGGQNNGASCDVKENKTPSTSNKNPFSSPTPKSKEVQNSLENGRCGHGDSGREMETPVKSSKTRFM